MLLFSMFWSQRSDDLSTACEILNDFEEFLIFPLKVIFWCSGAKRNIYVCNMLLNNLRLYNFFLTYADIVYIMFE